MTINYREIPEDHTIELTITGKVTEKDFEGLVPKFEAFIEAHNKVKILEIIKNFEGFEAPALWKGIKMDMKYLKNVSHCAIISDIGWISPLSKAAGALTSTKLRTFGLDQIEEARTWLRK